MINTFCGYSLEIDFVYLKFCLKDPRCQYSASQQVLKKERKKRGRRLGSTTGKQSTE